MDLLSLCAWQNLGEYRTKLDHCTGVMGVIKNIFQILLWGGGSLSRY